MSLERHAGHRPTLRSAFLVLGAAFLWSTSYTVAKVALDHVPPSTLALLRFLFAIAGLGVIYTFRHAGDGRALRPGDRRRLALCGLFGYTLYFALQNWGLYWAHATDAALIVAIYPALTALVERFVSGVHLRPSLRAGIGLTICGVLLIIRPWQVGAGVTAARAVGMLLIAFTGLVWSAFSITARGLAHLDATRVTLHQTLYGSLFILPLVGLERPAIAAIPAAGWLGVAYLGVFCSLLAFLLYNAGIRGLTAGQAVNLLNTVPLFGVLIAVLFLGEPLGLFQVAGGLLVLAGVYVCLR